MSFSSTSELAVAVILDGYPSLDPSAELHHCFLPDHQLHADLACFLNDVRLIADDLIGFIRLDLERMTDTDSPTSLAASCLTSDLQSLLRRLGGHHIDVDEVLELASARWHSIYSCEPV